jgi:hypothetical protein
MTNPLIRLDNVASIVADFRNLLHTHNRVILLVLGNTAAHVQLANDAVPYTDAGEGPHSFRYVVLVTKPQLLYPTILSLPLDAQCPALPPDYHSLYGVSIAMDERVCDQLIDTTVSDINLAFMMAETHDV